MYCIPNSSNKTLATIESWGVLILWVMMMGGYAGIAIYDLCKQIFFSGT